MGRRIFQQEQQHHHRAYPAFARKMNDTIDNPKYIKTVWGLVIKLKNKKRLFQTRTKTLHVYRCNCCGSNCIRVVYSFNDPRKLGDWILSILENKYDLNHLDAMKLYQYSIRNNIDIFIYVAIVISILILCRVMLSKFAKYFDEINTGIDVLIQNEDKQIELSAEMDVMEQKLNTLKRTLEKREQDAKLAEQRKMTLLCTWRTILKRPLHPLSVI